MSNNNTIEINPNGASEREYQRTVEGYGTVTIGKGYVFFFEKLQELPGFVKMDILGITEEEAEAYVEQKRVKLIEALTRCLKHRGWRSRETGESVVLADAIEYGPFPKDFNLRSLRSRKYNISEMETAISYFMSGQEIYSQTINF